MKLIFNGGPYNNTVREHPNAPEQIDFPKTYIMYLIHSEEEMNNLRDTEFYNYLLVEKNDSEALYEYVPYSKPSEKDKLDKYEDSKEKDQQ